MRTETITKELFSFDELSDEAKEKARDWWRDGGLDYEWYDGVYEHQMELIKEAGFDIDKIYFSGFWSQGDGAMFEYSEIDEKLFHEFVDGLNLSPMRKNWLKTQGYVTGRGKHRGHYYHSGCCSHDINLEPNFSWWAAETLTDWISGFQEDFKDFVMDKYGDLCSELYKALKEEHDWLNSDEQVDGTIRCNEYEFLEDGTTY